MPGRGSVRSNRAVNETKWSINISVLLKPIEPMPTGCAAGAVLTGEL